MNKTVLLFLALLCVPILHRLYSTRIQPTEKSPILHLAVIMDGNRRWADKHSMMKFMGHRQGAQTVKLLVKYCLEKGIKMVSIYAFSLENFKRDPQEIEEIFKILTSESKKAIADFVKYGVRVRFIGDTTYFPASVAQAITEVEQATAAGNKLQLNVLFCYGGRQEIVSAVQKIIADVKAGKITDIPNEAAFKKYLWTGDLPDPDLIIRTGGIKRLSNFLTYQTTYSELYFTDRLWPELTSQDLDLAIHEYSQRKRNFGK